MSNIGKTPIFMHDAEWVVVLRALWTLQTECDTVEEWDIAERLIKKIKERNVEWL